MRYIVSPAREQPGKWRWELIDDQTGEVFAGGVADTPLSARLEAHGHRARVTLAPIEMGT